MATARKTTAKAPAKAVAKRSATSNAKPGKSSAPAKSSAKTPAQPNKTASKPTKSATPNKTAAKSTKAPAKPASKSARRVTTTTPTKPAKATTAKATAAKATTTATTATAPAKAAPAKATTAKSTPAAKPARAAKPTKSTATPTTPAPKASTTLHMSSAKPTDTTIELPKPKFNKDGIGYTKDFDVAFVKQQYDALQAERVRLTGQALRLEAEAHSLVEEAEMGDVKFDDEGGEGDTMNVERERDLALSAQAREAIEEIDAALVRITVGTYGYSVVSGRLIPRERLEALPWSSVLVEEKVGGIGRR